MERAAELKVGLMVVAAAAAVAAVVWWVMGAGTRRGAYTIEVVFENAQGIREGDPVMLAGLRVGQVEEASLTPRQLASVKLRLSRGVEVRRHYSFQIATGTLIGERFVKIVRDPEDTSPPLQHGAQVVGMTTPSIQDVLEASAPLVDELLVIASRVKAAVSEQGLVGKGREAMASFSAAARAAERLAASMASIAATTGPHTEVLLRQAVGAMEDIRSITQTLEAHASRARAPRELESMAASLRSAAQRLDATAVSLQGLLADPQVQTALKGSIEDLRVTAANARQVSQQMKEMMPQARQAVESAQTLLATPAEIRRRLGVPSVRSRFDVLYSPDASRTWTDADVELELSRKRFFRLGMVGIGDEGDVNAQLGQTLGPGRLRWGLVRSALGLGYDLTLPRRSELSADLFNPNDPHLDLLGAYGLPGRLSAWSVVGGGRNLLAENDLVLGVRLRK